MTFISNNRNVFLLSIIMLIAISIRMLCYVGMTGADDNSIAASAIQIFENGFHIPNSHYALRIGLTIPLSWMFSIFGVSEKVVSILPLIYSMGSILLAYAIGKEQAGFKVGLYAALMLAVFPLDVGFSTSYYPDIPMGFCLALTFYSLQRLQNSTQSWFWVILAAASWGLGYFIRIEVVFFGLVLISNFITYKDQRTNVLAIIILFGCIVFLEHLTYWLLTDQVSHRLNVITHIKMYTNKEFSGTQLWVFPKAWFITFYEFGLYYYAFFAALLWSLFHSNYKISALLVWTITYLVWFQFGGNPFAAHYGVKSHLLRYLNALNVPMAVLISLMLQQGIKHIWLRRTILTFLISSGLFFINFNQLNHERTHAIKLGMRYVIQNNLFPIYLDQTSYYIAKTMLYGDPRFKYLKLAQDHDFASGKTKIINTEQVNGYLLLSPAAMRYKANRYDMQAYDVGLLQKTHQQVLSVDNPMNFLAYKQCQLFVDIGSLIPNEFLRNKIMDTGNEILKKEDVLIFKLDNKLK